MSCVPEYPEAREGVRSQATRAAGGCCELPVVEHQEPNKPSPLQRQ